MKNLLKRSYAPVVKLNRPLDKFTVLDEFLNSTWGEEGFGDTFLPTIKVTESKDNYFVVAELSGLNREDISIQIKNNSLYLTGEKAEEPERYYTKFTRVIPFSENIDADKIDEDFNQGILTVKLTKK